MNQELPKIIYRKVDEEYLKHLLECEAELVSLLKAGIYIYDHLHEEDEEYIYNSARDKLKTHPVV